MGGETFRGDAVLERKPLRLRPPYRSDAATSFHALILAVNFRIILG